MKSYLENLITEKGWDLVEVLKAEEGHVGLTWHVVIEFICDLPKEVQQKIKDKLVIIDFRNGDVFHFFNYIINGMVKL